MIGAVCRPAPSLVITLALRERIATPSGRARPCINAGWPETYSMQSYGERAVARFTLPHAATGLRPSPHPVH